MSSKRTGKQEPRVRVEPSRVYTDGPDAALLGEAYGFAPDPWQRMVLDSWLGRDEADMFTAASCGISVPRQNGKNFLIELRELYGLVAMGEQILHSAHEVKTAATAFRRLAAFFENPDVYPELNDLLLRVRRTNGQEAIELKNGGSITYSARSKGAARGMTFDLVVFDESSFLNDEQIEAMMSTMSAAPLGNRQIIYAGTPPDPKNDPMVFRRVRDRAIRPEPDKSVSWHEWSVTEIGDVHDRERWYDCNPALGIRLDEDFTSEECETMSEDGFARERLGWWSDGESANCIISRSKWNACKVDKAPKSEDEVLTAGVKFSPDGEDMSLSMAAKQSDGSVYIETIMFGKVDDSMGDAIDFLMERKDRIALVIIDGKAHSATFHNHLLEEKFPRKGLATARSKDMTDAASMMLAAISEKKVLHGGQPLLDASATTAVKRQIGQYGAFGFGSGMESSLPIESASLAFLAAKTTKRRPGRKAVVF